MANLLVEGFDWFPVGANTTDRSRIWAANNFFKIAEAGQNVFGDVTGVDADVETGRFGFGQALTFNAVLNFTPTTIGYVIPINSTPSIGFVGGAMFIYQDSDNSTGAVLGFFDGITNDFQLYILFSANGVVKLYRGDGGVSGVLLATSATGSFQENKWFHVEIKALISGTVGTVEVRINTVPVIQLVSANTKNTTNTYFDSIVIGALRVGNSRVHFTCDDFFVNDTTTANNNDWAGNLRVKTQFMTANGATDQMIIGGTSPAGTNWQSVLNQSLDDTKYVYSATVNNLDLYTPNPNLNAPAVRAVQVRAALRQDDATQRSSKLLLKIGATTYLSATEFFTNQTYTFYKQRWDLSPATSVTFTGAEVNAAQVGVKVQS